MPRARGAPITGSLSTVRLVLRPVGAADATSLGRLFHDPRVNRYLPPARRRESGREAIALSRRGARQGTLVRFGVRLRAGDRFVGAVTLFAINPDERRAEIGYALQRSEWGKGFAQEATGRVVEWAFRDLGLHRLEAKVVEGNDASIRVLRRLGFRPEGVLRGAARQGRRYADELVFGLLAPEWRGQEGAKRSPTPRGGSA